MIWNFDTRINNLHVAEEPQAPLIVHDDHENTIVGGSYAGPFNEGEDLKLVCQVHGGEV